MNTSLAEFQLHRKKECDLRVAQSIMPLTRNHLKVCSGVALSAEPRHGAGYEPTTAIESGDVSLDYVDDSE